MISYTDSPFWKIDETFPLPGAEPGLGIVPALEPKETGAVFIQTILYLYLKKDLPFGIKSAMHIAHSEFE